MSYSIYSIRNTVNNKLYIGYTKRSLNDRWRSHKTSARNGSDLVFHKAIREFGPDCWEIVRIGIHVDKEEAKAAEKFAIEWYGTMTDGYNARLGSGGWIVPSEKVEEWRGVLRVNNTGTGNPNHSGMTDDHIIECFLDVVKDGVCSRKDMVKKSHAKHGTPLHLKKDYRFVEYGGGEQGAEVRLLAEHGVVIQRTMSDAAKAKLSQLNSGLNWFTNPATGENKQAIEPPSKDWIRGRTSVKNRTSN